MGEALIALGYLTHEQVGALLRLQGLRRTAAARPAAGEPDPLIGATLAGCRVVAVVGRGVSGTTYRAHHPRLEREVALKVLHPELGLDPLARERFLQEARALSRLDHPALLSIHDAGEDQGRLYLVLPFVEGRSLAELLAAEGPLQPEPALRLALALARGLRAAHAAGVVHRDVKPQNVLVAWDGGVKLADFSLALLLDQPASGELAGTPTSMAPEQFLGEGVGPAADQYGLGVLLYEALSGRRLYPGDDLLAIARQHVAGKLPPLPGPPVVQTLLRRLLEKRPRRRFPDMTQATRAIAAALHGLGAPSDDPSGELPPLAEATPVPGLRGASMARGLTPEERTAAEREALIVAALTGDLEGLFAGFLRLPEAEGVRLGERVLGALERAGRPELLEAALLHLDEWRERWPRAPLLVARALRRAGRPGEALLALELAPDPEHPDALSERARALQVQSRRAELKELLETATGLERPEVVRRAGELQLELRDDAEGAARALTRLGELLPGESEPLEQAALLLIELGRAAEARAALQRAVERPHAGAHAWTLLGWACERQGDGGGARSAYERALGLDPEAEAVRRRLATLTA